MFENPLVKIYTKLATFIGTQDSGQQLKLIKKGKKIVSGTLLYHLKNKNKKYITKNQADNIKKYYW